MHSRWLRGFRHPPEPAKTKDELREMLAQAVRNTQSQTWDSVTVDDV